MLEPVEAQINFTCDNVFGNRSSAPETLVECMPAVRRSVDNWSRVTRSVFMKVTSRKLTTVISVHSLGFWQEKETITAYRVSGAIMRASIGSLTICCII